MNRGHTPIPSRATYLTSRSRSPYFARKSAQQTQSKTETRIVNPVQKRVDLAKCRRRRSAPVALVARPLSPIQSSQQTKLQLLKENASLAKELSRLKSEYVETCRRTRITQHEVLKIRSTIALHCLEDNNLTNRKVDISPSQSKKQSGNHLRTSRMTTSPLRTPKKPVCIVDDGNHI
jgi:hypothetical protein